MPTDIRLRFDGQRLAAQGQAAVLQVQFFNPSLGCMDAQTESELLALLDRVDVAPQWRVLLLTGRDAGVFMRHDDVGVLERRGRAMAARGLRFALDRPVPEAIRRPGSRRWRSGPAAVSWACARGTG